MSLIGNVDELSHKPFMERWLPKRVRDWICDTYDARLRGWEHRSDYLKRVKMRPVDESEDEAW